jgi:hypothetical protein
MNAAVIAVDDSTNKEYSDPNLRERVEVLGLLGVEL